MMKNRKHNIIILIIAFICFCLCLTACGKNNETINSNISQNQIDNKINDSELGSSTLNEKEGQPRIVQQENGSGVEVIDFKTDKGNSSTTPQSSSSNPTQGSIPVTGNEEKEIGHQEGVEPIDESKESDKPSDSGETNRPKFSSKAQEYIDYCAMSSAEQYSYFKKFDSADDFLNWYNEAKEAYDKDNQIIILEPGEVIDLGD